MKFKRIGSMSGFFWELHFKITGATQDGNLMARDLDSEPEIQKLFEEIGATTAVRQEKTHAWYTIGSDKSMYKADRHLANALDAFHEIHGNSRN